MRLHLPKALLAAVLAACLAWPAGAEGEDTSTITTVTITQQSDLTTNHLMSTAVAALQQGDLLIFNSSSALSLPKYADETTKAVAMPMDIRIDQALLISDGYSDTIYNFTGAISGTANFTSAISTSASNQTYNFSGSLAGFTGALSLSNKVTTTFQNVGTVGASSISLAGSTTLTGTFSTSGNLTSTGALTNNGSLTIASKTVNDETVGGSYTGGTITQSSNAKLTLDSGAVVNLDSLTSAFNLSNAETSGLQTYSKTWTLASGGAVDDKGATYKFSGSALAGSMTDGVFSAESVYNYYNIASGITQTYTEVTTVIDTNTVDFINVLGELSELSGSIATEIRGSGTLSMSAGAGEATIAADKLTGFTGDLVIHSGRFQEVKNGHVFSNVTVEDGGQFYLAGNGSYSGSVSIAGTGWDASDDAAKAGALRIGHEASLSGPLTLTDDAVILVLRDDAQGTPRATITGNLNLNGHTLTVKGSTGGLLFGTGVTIGSGEGMVNIVANEALIGVNAGGSLSILKDFTGKGLCSTGAGTITVGNGTDKVVTSVERIELGDTNTAANTTTLTVNANSVLKITGTDNGTNYKTASALLGEWSARTTATINGTLLSEAAALQAGDTGYTLNIGSTGLVTAKGIQRAKSTNATIAVNLNGGSLILGDTGIKEAGVTSTSTGGVIGSYADTTTIASGLSLTSGTTTIDTSKYTINGTTNTVTVGENASASSITVTGNISAADGTILKVTGVGALELSGTNTLYDLKLSGGTTTISGTTTVNGTKLGDTEHGVYADNAELKLKISGNGKLIHDGFNYVGTELKGLKNGLSMWNGQGADGIEVTGGSLEQTATDKSIYAKLNDVKLINGSGKTSTLGVNADLSGADIRGTLSINETTTTTIKNTFTDSAGATGSTIATLTGKGTLKTTGGMTKVTTATGFTGTLAATGGNIELQSAAALALSEVVVAGGSSITVVDTVTDVLSMSASKVSIGKGAAGSLVGNLSIKDNGTITLDASAGTTGTGLALGTSTTGSLTLGSGVTLNLINLGVLKEGESLTLFTGVTDFTYSGATSVAALSDDDVSTGNVSVDASEIFGNVDRDFFTLNYDATNHIVALVAQQDVPEPTTATLSLLALMGLAARRRRRKA